MITVLSREFYPSLLDGATFTDYTENAPILKANVGDRIKAVIKYRLQISSVISNGETFDFTTAGQCTRINGYFTEDGFNIGDTFKYYNSGGSYVFSGTVTGNTGKILSYTVTAGSEPSTVISADGSQFRYNGTTLAIKYQFGTPFYSEGLNVTNKLTGIDQTYIGALGSIDTLTDITPVTNNFETGGLQATSTTLLSPDEFTQEFTVEHIFVLHPYYLLDFDSYLQNGVIPLDFLAENLKYNSQIWFCNYAGEASWKTLIDNSVGAGARFFNQNINYQTNQYTLDSITYTDSSGTITGINPNETTHVVLVINSIGSSFHDDTRIYLAHSICKTPVFNNSADLLNTQLAFDYINGTLLTTGDGANSIITNFIVNGSYTAGQITVEFDIDNLDLTLIKNSDKFILMFGAANESLDINTSDAAMIVAGFAEYAKVTTDVTGLLTFGDFILYDFKDSYDYAHGTTGVNDSVTVWNEDEMQLEFGFTVNVDAQAPYPSPSVKNVRFQLEAHDNSTGESFVLPNSIYDIALNNTVTIKEGIYNVDNIHVADIRAYNDTTDSEFQRIWLDSTYSNSFGYTNTFAGLIAFKVDWQTWIYNTKVDGVFYDNGEPNNNLNNKASNYSELNGYRIKAAIIVSMETYDPTSLQNIITDYKGRSVAMIVRDYDKDSANGTSWTKVISTSSEDTVTDYNNALIYGENTRVKVEFTKSSSIATLEADMIGLIRIESVNAPNSQVIEFIANRSGNLKDKLGAVTGETLLLLTKVSSTVVTLECVVDGTKLVKGVQYKISAKLYAD